MNLDPVRGVSVFVEKSIDIAGNKLRDYRIGGDGRKAEKRKENEAKNEHA